MKKYFTIHSLAALELKQFSIIMANIDNTSEKVELAKKLYPDTDYFIGFHNVKYCMKIVIN